MKTQKEIKEILKALEDKYSKKQLIELDYINNFTLLVSIVLSAQSTDKGVNKATEKLYKVVTTPEQMFQLGVDGLKEYIKTIGLYNNKAKNIIGLSKILIEKHNSQVPSSREHLENLPGVGRKTANVILNVAFEQPTIAVDTHVFRVSNRIGLADAKNVQKTEMQLYDVIPADYITHMNHWLVLLGRYICQARKPKCEECPVAKFCNCRTS